MATLNLSASFGDDWPPEAFNGGVIQSRTATSMTYVSDLGYTIIVRGTGFTYDDDLFPSDGTVTRVTIRQGGQLMADLTGASMELQRFAMNAFGFDRGPDRSPQNPNGAAITYHLMRGNDVINGSAQDDEVFGGRGNDLINTGAGFDFITADEGNDTIHGGDDSDTLDFSEAYWDYSAYRGVVVNTTTGTVIDPWGGQDQISGIEAFRDTHYSDSFTGSAADEQFTLNRGNDTVIGGDGFDMIRFDLAERWGATRGVNVNLATGVVRDNWKGTDSVSGVEGVIGSDFNDTIIGSAGDDFLMGGDGVDAINGGLGFDTLGNWLVDRAPGGTGIVVNMNIAGATVQNDGFGNVENAVSIERFEGTRFGDSFTGNTAANEFFGYDGDDTMLGNGGNDLLRGGWGLDQIDGGAGNDQLWGDEGDDTMTGGANADDFFFQLGDLANAGVDHITDFSTADELWIGTSGRGGLSAGSLAAFQLRSAAGATSATTADQRFVYNRTTGDLYFDEDGVGGLAAVKIATLDNAFVLTAAYIEIF